MGLAQEQHGDNRKVDIISRFRDRYEEALTQARMHAKHTETEGWQALYSGFKASCRERLAACAKSLRGKADTIELVGTHEELEKDVGEEKKVLAAIRTEMNAFDQNTVQPIKQCTADCQQIITEAMSQARRDENETPLVNLGIEDLMRDAVASVPKVTWDEELGTVVITEPNHV